MLGDAHCELVAGLDLKRQSEGLGGDHVAPGLHVGHVIGRNRQRQVDAVRDVQAGVLTLVLNGAHDVAGVALGLELGGQLRVEHDEGARRQHDCDLALGGVH